MPSFEWNRERHAYIKQCISCDEVFIGAETQHESEIIFAKSFALVISLWIVQGMRLSKSFLLLCSAQPLKVITPRAMRKKTRAVKRINIATP